MGSRALLVQLSSRQSVTKIRKILHFIVGCFEPAYFFHDEAIKRVKKNISENSYVQYHVYVPYRIDYKTYLQ
jgi:hypothetical protein